MAKQNRNPNINFLQSICQDYCHGKNLLAKYSNGKLSIAQLTALENIVVHYKTFYANNQNLNTYDDASIRQRVDWLNNYYTLIDNQYPNLFTAQSKFRSTILEEFMYILFRDLISEKNDVDDHLHLGRIKAYSNLCFTARNFEQFIRSPQVGVNTKDQDFSIYRPTTICVDQADGVIQLNLPAIAIENKTYVDKTMLDGAIATADKIKAGNPYSKFFIVTETYEVDLTVDPVYSRIDQIYVLRKSNKRSAPGTLIDSGVVISMFNDVRNHLTRDWANVENKLNNDGKII